MKFFVSSDIHSAYTPWIKALNEAGFDKGNPDHMLVVCGDMFDRMSETRQVYDFVKDMVAAGKLIYVKGNHEELLEDCVYEISKGVIPGHHHFSNGTVKSICQFCGQNEWIIYDPTWTNKICETMQPILDFIDANSVDYFETKNYIFVHSWVADFDSTQDWREASDKEWSYARWGNPFAKVESGHLPDKTIVFGHFHTSHARARFDGQDEWGPDADFSAYYGNGFIGIDSCVTYTGKCNVLVIEDEFLNNDRCEV